MSESTETLNPLLDDLQKRGLFHQATNLEELSRHLAQPRYVYGGFDPTKDSLTIGNMVLIVLLKRFQLAGHKPVVLMGGGTGLIGDPSGKDAERQLQGPEQVQANVDGQRPIFEALLEFEGQNAATIVNNGDWIGQLSFVEVLRDIGKHFSVNMMIQKDSVKKRLEEREHGISYTEFSYMILQALDFSHLKKERDVSVQLGGSDQWGNIVAGVDLTRRQLGQEVFGFTTPLITKADGGKFGKTESGAIWLTRQHTSPYAFYQFWLNAADADIRTFMMFFSLKSVEELEALLAEQKENPSGRAAQRSLAEELTELLHGEQGLKDAKAATEALFSGNVKELSAELIDEAFAAAPATNLERSSLDGEGYDLVDLLVDTKVCKSKREARQFVGNGAVRVNGDVAAEGFRLCSSGLLHGRVALIRRGKKTWHVCRFGA